MLPTDVRSWGKRDQYGLYTVQVFRQTSEHVNLLLTHGYLPNPTQPRSSAMQLNEGQIHREKTLMHLGDTNSTFFLFFFRVIWSMLLTHKSLKRQIYPRALEHLGGKEYTEEMLEKAQWSYFWPPRVWTLLCAQRAHHNLHRALLVAEAFAELTALNTDGCIWLELWYRLISEMYQCSSQRRKMSLLYL